MMEEREREREEKRYISHKKTRHRWGIYIRHEEAEREGEERIYMQGSIRCHGILSHMKEEYTYIRHIMKHIKKT